MHGWTDGWMDHERMNESDGWMGWMDARSVVGWRDRGRCHDTVLICLSLLL